MPTELGAAYVAIRAAEQRQVYRADPDLVQSWLDVQCAPAPCSADRQAVALYALNAPPGAAPAADDNSAYRPMKEFLDATRFTTRKRLHKALKDNPWIRTRKPSSQRLVIHAGDFLRYRAMLDEAGFEAIDVSAETVDAFMAELSQRKAEIRQRRAGQ